TTPRRAPSLYQPATSVSRIAEKMAESVWVRTLSRLPFRDDAPGSTSINTNSLRERSARLRSRQSACRNVASGRSARFSTAGPMIVSAGRGAKEMPSYGITCLFCGSFERSASWRLDRARGVDRSLEEGDPYDEVG